MESSPSSLPIVAKPRLLPVWILPVGVIIVAWILAIRQLSLEWTINPEYQYGWIVPFLTLLLWWRAWPRRPAPHTPSASPLLPGLILLLAIAAFPLRVIEEANPDWRLLNYYFAGQAIIVTSLVVYAFGGRGWLRYFAFPLLFPLIAVPWPSGPETALIQGLQRYIASISVEGASWLGWSATQSGSLIILPHGIVGVNEACSGIRSLQSSLMIALFLGEYFRLSAGRRWGLILLALVSAFVFNAARAFFLMVMMDWHGADGVLRFHDPAGMGIALASLILLWVAANFLARGQVDQREEHPIPVSSLRLSKSWLIILLAAWLGAEVLNQAWYLWHERQLQMAQGWTLHWPPPRPDFQEKPIDDVARSYLRYDSGWHGKWQDTDQWELFYFIWNPGRASVGLAQSHRPDICLPAAGFVLKDDLGIKQIDINGLLLPFHRYIFQDSMGRQLNVFQAVTDDRVWLDGARGSGLIHGQIDRLQAAWAGRRNPGQRSLLIVNQGAIDFAQAEQKMANELKDLLVVQPLPKN